MENITEPIMPEGKERRTPTPLAGSTLYLVVLSLMLLTSFLNERINLEGNTYYLAMFFIQIAAIGLPPILYLIANKIDIRKAVRLNRIRIPEVLLSIGMAFFGYGVIIFINLLWVLFLTRFGTPQTQQLPPIETGPHFLMAIIVIAGASILLTGTLFAFLHLSIVSIPAIILMGLLLCYITYRADSLWAGAVYHFTNNMIAVTITYLSGVISKLFPMEGMSDSLADIPPETLKMAVAAWGVIGVVALVLFLACFAGFHRITEGKQEVVPMDTGKTAGQKLLQLLPAILAVIIIIVLLVFQTIEMVSPSPVM